VRSMRIIFAGLIGGFIGNGVLGALFSAPFLRAILYDPSIQSRLFIELTPQRNIPVSVAGLVVLSVFHSWFYSIFEPSIPGGSWQKKGIFWGFTIWAMYWLTQEWFIYHTLLQEPLILNLLELAVLFLGSIVEGLVIAKILSPKASSR